MPSETSEPRWPHLRFDHLFVVYNHTPTQTPPQPLSGSAVCSDPHISRYVLLCFCSPSRNKIRPSWTETEGMFARQQACETKSYDAMKYNIALWSLEEHRCITTRSSTRALDPSGSDHHTVDRSTSHQRTAMAAVASPTAQADALLAQTPTAPPAPHRRLVAPTCPLVAVLGALHLAATPTADALLPQGTDTWHPEATATGPVLARRHL